MNASPPRFGRDIRLLWIVVLATLCAAVSPRAAAVELDEVRPLFINGDYSKSIRLCNEAIADSETSEEWRLLLARSLMAVGQYSNAASVISTNLDRYPWSIRIKLLGYEIFRQNGRAEDAATALAEINNLLSYRMWAYQDAANLVTVGKVALLLGADPRRVLEQFYDLAKRRDPASREPLLASGQLALDKNDYALAAKVFGEGLKKFPNDPDFQYGLAQAYAPSDRRLMIASIEAALNANTNHVPSFLLLVDHLVDGEEYEGAEDTLKKALAVNPHHPEAWAFRAVIAHLRNDSKAETAARDAAMLHWKTNPEVDHIIGRKLSQKYRFTEGAASQRRALKFDPRFLPARIQLSQDLLRLGQEEEGWQLAESVHESDAYDATAFNLVTLQENMAKFATLTNGHFVVRMATNEAVIYGHRVMALLERARTNLCAKYGLELTTPTIVEIFPEPKDFGVRTFGMPGNPGYLGVCFGSVITANSPASQAGHPANWEAVLWHEFCHVVTLQMTRNKMPRWLSEGISVYEELQENPTWGQSMTPRYREMILGEDFTPLGELSAAFLAPKTEMHLQFAYYESYLAVDFLAGKFGIDAIKKILRDLGEGAEINSAITNHTEALDLLEKDFAAFARDRAEKLAPALDFAKPERGADLDDADTTNYYLLVRQARKLLREKKWAEAKAPAEKLLKAFPSTTGPENAYSLLAEAHRGLGETNEERVILTTLAGLEADDLDTYSRLMELDSAAKDWAAVAKNAGRFLAVNPLMATPYRHLAEAAEQLDKRDEAISACKTLLMLDPPDPAGTHFQLARLLHQSGETGAKRHLLQALEEAPRFRAGHKLLLELTRPAAAPTPAPAPEPAPSPAAPAPSSPPAKP